MDPTLAEMNQKIDALAEQLAYLANQAQIAERQRQDRAELIRDLTPIGQEAFRLTVEQLEEVQELLQRYRGVDHALDVANRYSQQAAEALAPLAPGPAKESLLQLTEFVVVRLR